MCECVYKSVWKGKDSVEREDSVCVKGGVCVFV